MEGDASPRKDSSRFLNLGTAKKFKQVLFRPTDLKEKFGAQAKARAGRGPKAVLPCPRGRG